jgi:predicted regulator of Ras-like GTPase activity (Roadblock/LC7/MglB family)
MEEHSLEEFISKISKLGGIRYMGIVKRTGGVIAGLNLEDAQIRISLATCSAIFRSTERILQKFECGNLDWLSATGKMGNIISRNIGEDILIIITEPRVDINSLQKTIEGFA